VLCDDFSYGSQIDGIYLCKWPSGWLRIQHKDFVFFLTIVFLISTFDIIRNSDIFFLNCSTSFENVMFKITVMHIVIVTSITTSNPADN
jgi:hypothetical protein